MSDAAPRTFRLILWPSILTLLISIARLVGEVQGWIDNQTGGGGAILGITWCVFVFGGWFGWCLARAGTGPRMHRAWLWTLLCLLAIVAGVAWRFGNLDPKDTSDAGVEALYQSVLINCCIAGAAALACAVVWWRLAWTLLCYGLVARLGVLVLTWLAKGMGWNTHYTKFGPGAIERDLADTLKAASIAQLGFWVPFTIVAGAAVGSLCARLAVRSPKASA